MPFLARSVTSRPVMSSPSNQIFPAEGIVQTEGLTDEEIHRDGHRHQLHIVGEMNAMFSAEDIKTNAVCADHSQHTQQGIENSKQKIKNSLIFLDHGHTPRNGPMGAK